MGATGVERLSRFFGTWLLLAVALAACQRDAEPTSLTIRVRGEDYHWRIQYPGPDGRLDTSDDVQGEPDLYIAVSTDIAVELESADYIYGFRIPDFGVNEMAIPDLFYYPAWRAESVGSYPLRGDQMCGFQHASLLGRVVVHSKPGYRQWLEGERP